MLKELFTVNWVTMDALNQCIIEECKTRGIPHGYDKYFNLIIYIVGEYRRVFPKRKSAYVYAVTVDI